MEEISAEVNRILEPTHRMMQNVASASTSQHVRLQFDLSGCNRDQKKLFADLKQSERTWQRGLAGPGGRGVSPQSGTIPFVKAVACGNDFLLIDAAQIEGSYLPKNSRRLPSALRSAYGHRRRWCGVDVSTRNRGCGNSPN